MGNEQTINSLENEKVVPKLNVQHRFNLKLEADKGSLQLLKGVNENDQIKTLKKRYLNDFGNDCIVDNLIWEYNNDEMYNNKSLKEHGITKENTLPIIVEFCDNDDGDGKKEANVISLVFSQHKNEETKNNQAIMLKNDDGTNYGYYAGRWPHGIVPYIFDESVSDDMKLLINNAIIEFNKKTPVQWIAKTNEILHVIFQQDPNDELAFSPVGCTYSAEPHYIQLTEHIPETEVKLRICHVIHEMMHILGFVHEHQRLDSTKHHNSRSYNKGDPDFMISKDYISIGPYDYKSVMHYPYSLMHINTNEIEEEMKKNIGILETFSAGDIAAIKRLYGLRSSHYGDWHEGCTKLECNEKVCRCGACGQIDGGVWCGWYGKRNTNGHWTCCMSEDKSDNICKSKNHTGYYHMPCDKNECTKRKCVCGACGGGCQFGGNHKKGHWSCCGVNSFNKWCTTSPYKKTTN